MVEQFVDEWTRRELTGTSNHGSAAMVMPLGRWNRGGTGLPALLRVLARRFQVPSATGE